MRSVKNLRRFWLNLNLVKQLRLIMTGDLGISVFFKFQFPRVNNAALCEFDISALFMFRHDFWKSALGKSVEQSTVSSKVNFTKFQNSINSQCA